jgi:hypothetical protein
MTATQKIKSAAQSALSALTGGKRDHAFANDAAFEEQRRIYLDEKPRREELLLARKNLADVRARHASGAVTDQLLRLAIERQEHADADINQWEQAKWALRRSGLNAAGRDAIRRLADQDRRAMAAEHAARDECEQLEDICVRLGARLRTLRNPAAATAMERASAIGDDVRGLAEPPDNNELIVSIEGELRQAVAQKHEAEAERDRLKAARASRAVEREQVFERMFESLTE